MSQQRGGSETRFPRAKSGRTFDRRDDGKVLGVEFGQPFDQVDLFQRQLNGVQVLSSTRNVCRPELQIIKQYRSAYNDVCELEMEI